MKWISVKERLPEIMQEVLCYTIDGEYWTKVYCDGDSVLGLEWDCIEPTHWMPLPEPPTEEA